MDSTLFQGRPPLPEDITSINKSSDGPIVAGQDIVTAGGEGLEGRVTIAVELVLISFSRGHTAPMQAGVI